METIRKVRKVEAVRVDEECPTLLSDYLEKITGDIYLTLGEFCGENYVSVRRYYTDRDGNLRPRKEGVALTLGQFAILVDSMSEIESRYWAFEEELSVSPFVQYVGPWKISIDIFGNLSIWKHYYDQTKKSFHASEQGHFFSFVVLQTVGERNLPPVGTLSDSEAGSSVLQKYAFPNREVRQLQSVRALQTEYRQSTFRSKVSRTIIDCYLSQKIFLGNHIRTIFIYSCRHFCGVLFYCSRLYLIKCGNEKLCVVKIYYVSI